MFLSKHPLLPVLTYRYCTRFIMKAYFNRAIHVENNFKLLDSFLLEPPKPLNRESIPTQCMDIHRNPRISEWISIKACIIEDWCPGKLEYPFIDIYYLRISITECPCMHCWYQWKHPHSYCMDNWRLTSKYHWYSYWYPWIVGNPCMDMLWILGPGARNN